MDNLPVHLFPCVGQLARLPQLQKGVADGPRVAAQILPVRLGQQLGHGEGHAAHPQGQHRPVGDLLHHQLGNLEVGLAGLPVAAKGQGLVLPLHHIVRLAQMDPVGAVHPLEPGQLLVDLKNYGAGALGDGPPGIVRDAQAAVPLSVRPGHRYEGHVAADVPVPVQIGQGTQHGGHEPHQPPALELALIVPDVPAVVCKGLLLRVLLHHLDPGADHQAAPDLHVPYGPFPPGQRPVQQLREAGAEAVVYPVAGLDRLNRLFGRDKFDCLLVNHYSFPPFQKLPL